MSSIENARWGWSLKFEFAGLGDFGGGWGGLFWGGGSPQTASCFCGFLKSLYVSKKNKSFDIPRKSQHVPKV